MISIEEASERIRQSVGVLPFRQVTLHNARGCYAAADMAAGHALPGFDNSAMDGYAVRSQDCTMGARLRVVGEQAAGRDRGLTVSQGEAIRIFTGAPLPAGADAVVMQEDTMVHGDEVVLQTLPEPGEFVRRRGGDIAGGQRMLEAGARITPQMIALLAAQGVESLTVGGQVRAAIVSTGDELVEAGEELAEGQIYDSNTALVRALVEGCGAGVASSRHCFDRAEEVESAVRAGAACDVLIIIGGVSVGARDFVKEAIQRAGGALDFWRVKMKPGKPFLYGRVGRCQIFGLPGNPVSAFVTFLLLVRPALLSMMAAGRSELSLPARPARLRGGVENPGDRPHYLRGILAEGVFRPIGRQESHALFGLSRSNALLRLEPDETLGDNDLVTVQTWD